MSYFPMCIDLTGQLIYLIGDGAQIRDKRQKLLPFGPRLIQKENFQETDAAHHPAMVIVGDDARADGERIARLCERYAIPVNVVDMPQFCTFYFPALIQKGGLTLSISTGGQSPGAAAWLRRRIEESLPEETELILDWLSRNRAQLRSQGVFKAAVDAAFRLGRPLTQTELEELR